MCARAGRRGELDRIETSPAAEIDPREEIAYLDSIVLAESKGYFDRILGLSRQIFIRNFEPTFGHKLGGNGIGVLARAYDPDGNVNTDLTVNLNHHVNRPELFDRVLEENPLPVEIETTLRELAVNIRDAHRPEEHVLFTRPTLEGELGPVE